MTQLPPWSPPAGHGPDRPLPPPGEPPPHWSPDGPPPPWSPGGPPPSGRRSGPRGAVVAVVLVGVIAVLGLAGLALVRDGGDDDPGFIAAPPSSLPADPPGGIEPAEVAEGFEPFVDHDGSFALSVPVGWETVPLDDATVGRARDRLEDENPRVAASLEQIDRIVADRGLAFAAEPDDQDGFVANLNLLVVPRSTEPLIDTAAAGRAELEAQGFRVGDPQAVEIGERSGLIAAIELDTPTGTIVERQLYLASGYRVYVLTVAGVDAATADRIVGSLRVP